MTIDTLIHTVAVALRPLLTVRVEECWRTVASDEPVVYVEGNMIAGELGANIGKLRDGDLALDVMIEWPWDNKRATYAEFIAAVEVVRLWVRGHRDLDDNTRKGKHGDISLMRVGRPGATKGTYLLAIVPIMYSHRQADP